MSATQDLWPEITPEEITPPVAILREQASKLGPKTNNLVEATVYSITAPTGDRKHAMFLEAPSLDYRYELFSITHGIEQYPLEIQPNIPMQAHQIQDEDEFLAALKQIFSHPKTLHIINVLLSEIQSETEKTPRMS